MIAAYMQAFNFEYKLTYQAAEGLSLHIFDKLQNDCRLQNSCCRIFVGMVNAICQTKGNKNSSTTRRVSLYTSDSLPTNRLVYLPPRRVSMSGSVSTLSLLHAISEEEAVPWPEFNPNRRNSAFPTVPASHATSSTTVLSTYHAGTAESVSHRPIGVARSLGLPAPPSSPKTYMYMAGISNPHPGVTQSDTETARLVGVVTSPLALRRRNRNNDYGERGTSNRLRAAQSFIRNSRENSSCSTNNSSTNTTHQTSNTLSSSGGGSGGSVRVRVPPLSSTLPRKLSAPQQNPQQQQQHLQQQPQKKITSQQIVLSVQITTAWSMKHLKQPQQNIYQQRRAGTQRPSLVFDEGPAPDVGPVPYKYIRGYNKMTSNTTNTNGNDYYSGSNTSISSITSTCSATYYKSLGDQAYLHASPSTYSTKTLAKMTKHLRKR